MSWDVDAEEASYRQKWMTDDQWSCAIFLRDLFRGFHHVLGEIKPCGTGIKLNTSATNWAATYDYDGLTRAVVMAHDRMVRFEFRPSGPRMMQLSLFQRHKREGKMHERHPTLEEAIAATRKMLPPPEGEVERVNTSINAFAREYTDGKIDPPIVTSADLAAVDALYGLMGIDAAECKGALSRICAAAREWGNLQGKGGG